MTAYLVDQNGCLRLVDNIDDLDKPCKIVYAQQCRDPKLLIDVVNHMVGRDMLTEKDVDLVIHVAKTAKIFLDRIPLNIQYVVELDLENKLRAIDIGLHNWYRLTTQKTSQ